MLRDFRPSPRTLYAVLAIALATTACGIKKPLTPPPKASPSGTAAPSGAQPDDPKAPPSEGAAPSRL
jgi:predicted small lipoprotein YifL